MKTELFEQPFHPDNCPRCRKETLPNNPFCTDCKFDLSYGSIKIKKHGNCIYCRKYGKFSKEHIFPDWLKKHYPRRYNDKLHILNRPEQVDFFDNIKMHNSVEISSGDPYSTKIKNVCTSCNNNWMGKLQNEAKNIVKNLADGKWPNFNESERNVLTRWAIMLTINLEYHGRIQITTNHQRTELMNGNIPSGWRIYIARMENDNCAGESFYRAMGLPSYNLENGNLKILRCYFCIEKVCFWALSTLGDRTLELATSTTTGLDDNLNKIRCLWPRNDSADGTKNLFLTAQNLVDIQENKTFIAQNKISTSPIV